jgi:hypothetical protein
MTTLTAILGVITYLLTGIICTAGGYVWGLQRGSAVAKQLARTLEQELQKLEILKQHYLLQEQKKITTRQQAVEIVH